MLGHSFGCASAGIWHTIKNETSFRVMMVCLAFVIALGLIFRISAGEWLAVLICSGGVLATELINTAIEVLVDILSPQFQPRAKIAKDVAAGAALAWSAISFVIGLNIFIPYFLELF